MMDRELQSTDNATLKMKAVLESLHDHLSNSGDHVGERHTSLMLELMKGRSLVMGELNGALACSIHLANIGIPEHPTDEHRQQWRDLMRVAEHVS